jgi:Domain of unknown function (DUF4303)
MSNDSSILITDRSEQLLQATVAIIKQFKAEHPKEKQYSFSFVAPPEGTSVCCTFATEEGLTNIATEYVNNVPGISKDNSIETQRISLRWLNPDEGWYYYYFGDIFDGLWLQPFITGGLEEFDESTEDICVDTLKELDKMGLFGKGDDRNLIVIGFTYGYDPDDFLNFAKEVNPPIIYDRLCVEIRESCKINGVESPV